ncbi:MAG TPA: acyl-CoA dehydrogenase family protein [Micromonosporaceae bacterium]|nr:acyl-CoA dehydrogenase family protein [Micromonosporaceae bacterium]
MSQSFLSALRGGHLRWDLVHPFPEQEPADRAAGAAVVADLRDLLADGVDNDEVEASGALPAELVADLYARGLMGLTVPAEDGGLGLSPLNTFRVLEAASRRSVPVGLVLSWHNVLSMGAYLRALPPGPLRDLLVAALARGAVFGVADTEPGLAASDPRRGTVAVPSDDGGGYLLTGEKCFIGNGALADLLAVSATVRRGDTERIDLFVVDTASPGFTVVGQHDFMGLRGSPNGAMRLERVYVPADRVLVAVDGGWRASPLVQRINARARMNITVAPALALAKACLAWSRDFLARRRVGGRPLAAYDAVQRRLATSVAEVFAVDTVVTWVLSASDAVEGAPEYMSTKNIGTVTSWRVIDRTMSLLGAEGFEAASSKARRGVPALPLERAFRDARGLLIAGGVDFNIDMRGAQSGIFSQHYDRPDGSAGTAPAAAAPAGPMDLRGAQLSAANRRHLDFAHGQAAGLSARCRHLARRYPAAELFERQEVLITVNRLADELFTAALVLARAAGLTARGEPGAQDLADVYCAGTRARVAGLWQALDAVDEVDHAPLARAWLGGDLTGGLAQTLE